MASCGQSNKCSKATAVLEESEVNLKSGRGCPRIAIGHGVGAGNILWSSGTCQTGGPLYRLVRRALQAGRWAGGGHPIQ